MNHRPSCAKTWMLAVVAALTFGTGSLATFAADNPANAASPATLRVCTDPDNLPFSKSEGGESGLYVELADMVGKKLGSKVEFVWWLSFNQRKALRNTILQNDCDAYFALPAGGDYRARGLQKTPAFMDVGYAVVAAPSFAFNSLADLKGKKIAVQFSSTPQLVMSQREGYTMVTFRESEEAMTALSKGEVDAAFLWGPIAGFENKKRFQSRFKVTPVIGLDLNGKVAVAVPAAKEALRANISKALLELQPEITRLAEKYGFPQIKPIDLAAADKSSKLGFAPSSALVVRSGWVDVQAEEPKPKAKPAPKKDAKDAKKDAKKDEKKAEAAPAAPVLSDAAKAGRVRFNDQCSHCHSVDGASPVPERNLRRVLARYDAKWKDMAITTIKNGRADAGMPPWKDQLGEKEIGELISFIETIQK